MKNLFSISKTLLLAVLFTGFGLSASAQTAEATFGKIGAAISKGDTATLEGMFNSSVELTVPGSDKTYSAKQAGFVVKDFFAKHNVTGFKMKHKGNSGATQFATGTTSTAKGDFDTNIFLKKVGDGFKITQIFFEED